MPIEESIEQLKLNPEDFGGLQTRQLTITEAQQRYCAKKNCSDRGRVQIAIPGEDLRLWRVLCARHFIMIMIIQAHALGDPSPLGEGRRLAEKMGILDAQIPDPGGVPTLVDLSKAICDKCGGSMMTETIGMFKGRRFVHTCPNADDQQVPKGLG